MKLAEAVSRWGHEHQHSVSAQDLTILGTIWEALQGTPQADIEVDALSKDDARAIMAFFDEAERPGVSDVLNRVRSWALGAESAAAPVVDAEPVKPVAPTPLPGSETVVLRPGSDHIEPASTPPAPAGQVPPAPAGQVPPAPGGQVPLPPTTAVPSAPLPPTAPVPVATVSETADATSSRPPIALLAGLGLAVLAALVWFVFLRGGDDEVATNEGIDPAPTAIEAQSAPVAEPVDPAEPEDEVQPLPAPSPPPADPEPTPVTESSAEVVEEPVTAADEPAEPDPEPTEAAEFSGDGSGDFCAAASVITDEFDDAGILTEEFFDQAEAAYAQALALAPDEIRPDVELLADFQAAFGEIAERYDYDIFNTGLSDELDQLLATSPGVDQSSIRLETYLRDVCGIETDTEAGIAGGTGSEGIESEAGGAVPPLGGDAAAINEFVLSQFGLEPELIQCITDEVGDVTEALADPALLQQPICGTTLFEILANAPG